MLLERTDFDPFVLFAALMALVASVWISHEVKASHMLRNSRLNGPLGLVTAATLAAMLAGVWVGFERVVLPLAAFFGLASIARAVFRNFSTSGIAWLTVDFFGLIVGGASGGSVRARDRPAHPGEGAGTAGPWRRAIAARRA